MNRITKIRFDSHPVLGGLEFDFTDRTGRPVDTVIVAGENGVGKSKLIEALYSSVRTYYWGASLIPLKSEVSLDLLVGSSVVHVQTDGRSDKDRSVEVNGIVVKNWPGWAQNMTAIYSPTGVANIVKSNDTKPPAFQISIDSPIDLGYQSGESLAVFLNRLLYDLQVADDRDIASAYSAAKAAGRDLNQVTVNLRVDRFIKAFNRMFSDLTYDHVELRSKQVVFKKRGIEIPVDQLSGGERQIIYRSISLLRNIGRQQGAFVFIDEPEEGLHPEWQKKILQYYRDLFTAEDGTQASQLFVVTHSPFIIHNDRRVNDKVIVMKRLETGEIIVSDKPEYYTCGSVEAIRDAFSVDEFSAEQSCVYVEGRTDELYLTCALETFGVKAPFRFKWVGHLDENGQEQCTGAASLNKAYQFLVGNNMQGKRQVCLFDSDTRHEKCSANNVYAMTIPRYENSCRMRKGIENALVLDDVDLASFKREIVKPGDYGVDSIIGEFDKMACCKCICSLPIEARINIFSNLRTVIQSLLDMYKS